MRDEMVVAREDASHRGCSGTTEGTKPIDRAALEKALEVSEDRWRGDSFVRGIPCEDWSLVQRAAYAHLATLPKTKMVELKRWVSFDYGNSVLPDEDHEGYILNLKAHRRGQPNKRGQWVTFKVEVPA